jgi:hypothetical protein
MYAASVVTRTKMARMNVVIPSGRAAARLLADREEEGVEMVTVVLPSELELEEKEERSGSDLKCRW